MTQAEKTLQKELQLYYQKGLAEGKTRREAKKFARALTMGHEIPFSDYEKRFINEHPENRGKVSETCYLVKKKFT